MMKLLLAMLSVVLLIASALASYPDPLSAVYVTEVARPGDEVLVHVGIENERSSMLEDVRVYAYMPELALFGRTTGFDVDDDESVSRTLVLTLPLDTPKGLYLVLIGASNQEDGFRSRDFRYVLVV